jgi:Tfp pilus assembly pilus retraction ATPase PilT
MQTGLQTGMKTMNISLQELYTAGKIKAETALDWSIDKEDMQRQLRF